MAIKRNLNANGVEEFPEDEKSMLEKKRKWYNLEEAIDLTNEIGSSIAKSYKNNQSIDYKFNKLNKKQFQKKVRKDIILDLYIPHTGEPRIKVDENKKGRGAKPYLYNFAVILALVHPFMDNNNAMYKKHSKLYDAIDDYHYEWRSGIKKSLEGILKHYGSLDNKDRSVIIDGVVEIIDNQFVKSNSALSGQNKLLIDQNKVLFEEYSHYYRLYNQIKEREQLLDRVQNELIKEVKDLKGEIKEQGGLLNEHLVLGMNAVTKKIDNLSSIKKYSE